MATPSDSDHMCTHSMWLDQHLQMFSLTDGCRSMFDFWLKSIKFTYAKRQRLASHPENCSQIENPLGYFQSCVSLILILKSPLGRWIQLLYAQGRVLSVFSFSMCIFIVITMETIQVFNSLLPSAPSACYCQFVNFHHLNSNTLMEFRSPRCQEYRLCSTYSCDAQV